MIVAGFTAVPVLLVLLSVLSWRWRRRVARARIALDAQGRKRVGL